jgi:two-component system OmpR family sensor kinase
MRPGPGRFRGRHRHRGRRRLHQQLFSSFGFAILAAMLVSTAVFVLFHGQHGQRPWVRPLALFAAGNVLWIASGWAARRIAWPLRELARVAGELGRGKLESRVSLPRHGAGEIGELAASFNDMATRIEAQITSQKELLGAVSHELRTPLARLRVLLALVQESGTDATLVAKLEREIVEMDALVGELLAGARVDAGALVKVRIGVEDLVRESVERSGLPAVQIELAADAGYVEADATLLSRALAVLLDNAHKHGGARINVRVHREPEHVVFAVEDDGPGIDLADLPRLFEPFARGRGKAPDEGHGVGLGLYLVRRIAEAHGGEAFAQNRPEGGASIGFTLSG